MKKILVLVIALAMLSGFAFAADNQDATYVRMLSREAATDSIDIAYYNPAGTAFLEPGFHIELNNQFVYLNYSHTDTSDNEYPSKKFIPLFPTAYIGYNGGNWAGFASFTIPEGGGTLNYKDGASPYTPPFNGEFGGSDAMYAISAGGSYRFGDFLSIGALGTFSIRGTNTDINITSHSAIDGNGANFYVGEVEMKAKGTGFGGAFGVNVRPMDNLHVAVTVIAGQKVEMEYESIEGTALTVALVNGVFGLNEGDKYDADTPWKIRAGAAYTMPFGLVVSPSFKYNIWKGVDSNLRNSWSSSLGLVYPLNDLIEVSFGTSYAIDEVKDADDYDPLNPELSSLTLAGGAGFDFSNGLKADFGVLYPIYFSESNTTLDDMSKQVINGTVGVSYQF